MAQYSLRPYLARITYINTDNEVNQVKSRRAHQTRPKDNSYRNCSAAWSGAPCGPGNGVSETLFPLGSLFAYRGTPAGICSPIHPTVRIWPLQTNIYSGS
jgi:hypothetical protein